MWLRCKFVRSVLAGCRALYMYGLKEYRFTNVEADQRTQKADSICQKNYQSCFLFLYLFALPTGTRSKPCQEVKSYATLKILEC